MNLKPALVPSHADRAWLHVVAAHQGILPGSDQRNQEGFETYWRMLVTPSLTVTPGVSFVFNPSFNPSVDHMVIPIIKLRWAF
jgi:hypothetical protein